MDDGDSENNQKTKREKSSIIFFQRDIINACHVFPTFWVRRLVQDDYGSDGVLLDSGYSISFYFRMLLFVLWIAYEVFK